MEPSLSEENSTQEGNLQPQSFLENPVVQALLLGVGVLLYCLFGLLLWWLLDQYFDPQESNEKKDLIQALALIMAGLAGVIGIFFTWRSQRLTQKGLELTKRDLDYTRKNTENTLRLTREWQINERFTRAIDQLGATEENRKQLEIRVGGIYALEGIANDFPEGYQSTVIEILTVYVRENAPWPAEESDAAPQVSEGAEQKVTSVFPALSADIQAILDVLSRLNVGHERVSGRRVQINLQRSNLRKANLRNADFAFSILRETNLHSVEAVRAHFNQAMLRRAVLTEANLQGAKLGLADLRNTHLQKALLNGADLGSADLRNADLRSAQLRDANLYAVKLKGAVLDNAQFTGANLDEADLKGADLGKARGLTQPQLRETIGDPHSTVLPDRLEPPSLWEEESRASKEAGGRLLAQMQAQRRRAMRRLSKGDRS